MSNNMYDTYDGCKFSYYTPSDFDNRTRDYLLSRYTPKAAWDYNDTLTIAFNLVECPNVDDSVLDALEGKFVRVNFYDFRYETIPFEYEAPAETAFNVAIDYENSKKYFDRGTYYCDVKLITYTDEEKTDIEDYTTLLPREYCCFYVQ